MANATDDLLDALFPSPAPPPSTLSPNALPGVTMESGAMLVKLLKADYGKHHCFFNDKGYHNHLTHHLFAAYKMGAQPTLLNEAYELHAPTQRAAFPSPGPINDSNWKKHLGDENYYASYLAFFSGKVLKNGIGQTLESFVFALDANWAGFTLKDASKAPQMANRFLAGLLHPLIHVGHGTEFGLPGMVAEGLSWTAVHTPTSGILMPPDFFGQNSTLTSTLVRMATLSLRQAATGSNVVHSFTLLKRMIDDPLLAPVQRCTDDDDNSEFSATLIAVGDRIRSYAQQWNGDCATDEDLAKKVEELSWLAVLIYGVGGWNQKQGFLADFFTMHLVTSSLFMPSVLANLSRQSQSALLRSYLSVTLGQWVSRGRPKFDIDNFFKGVTSTPGVPLPPPKPNSHALDKEHITQNSWLPVVTSTLSHPNEHFLKLQRALLHYGRMYGTRPKGHWSGTELEGAEMLDGSLFIRAAGLSLQRLGAVREGAEPGEWDRIGFWDWN